MATYAAVRAGNVEHRWLIEQGVYQRTEAGRIVAERPFDADDQTWVTLLAAAEAADPAVLLTRIRTALGVNKTYLDKVQAGTATNADHTAQVAALTRQVTRLILHMVAVGGE